MSVLDLIVLGMAGLFAGVLNAIAGGGTFLTFPALVYAGIPIISANASATLASFPGYLSSALGYREDMRSIGRKQLMMICVISLIGGAIGSVLLLISSNDFFSRLAPFLLLAATTAFLYGRQIQEWARGKADDTSKNGYWGLFAVSTYGGYFNGGLGIILLALFSLLGWRDINQMNGLKSLISFVLSTISVLIFAVYGLIVWREASIMMIFVVLGGFFGARLARRLPPQIIRGFVGFVGYLMSVIFFVRLFYL